MNGHLNFRDLCDGEPSLRSGIVYRSGHLSGIEQAFEAALLSRDWSVIVDLRYPDERRDQPSPWPDPHDAEHLCIEGGSSRTAPHFEMLRTARANRSRVRNAFRDFYATLAFDEDYRKIFRRALSAIAHSSGPALIHCTAGKDRTGILAALLLDVAGAPRSHILADFLKSRAIVTSEEILRVRKEHFSPPGEASISDADIRALLGVEPEYIEAMFDSIARTHGSSADYFRASGVKMATLDALGARLSC